MPLLSLVRVEAGDANAEAAARPGAAGRRGAGRSAAAPASGDERARALPAPAGGLPAARNLALDEARGDHIWFLDGGLEPGALAGVGERLRSAAPDIVLAAGGRHKRLLDRVARDGVTTLERRPALADAAPGLGDKVLRREHLRELGVRFGPEPGGELAVTWPALLAAERIAAAPGRSLRGARPRRAAVAGRASPTTRPCSRSSPRTASCPTSAARLVLGAMLRRELAALDRLRGTERREHFDALSDAWRRHRRGDEPIRGGRAAQLEARLVERSDRRALQALREAERGRRALSRRRSAAVKRARKLARDRRTHKLERHYRARAATSRSTPTSPSSPPTGTAATPATRARSTRRRASSCPGMRGVWVVKPKRGRASPTASSTSSPARREYYDVIARARVLRQQRQLPEPPRQARRAPCT